MKLPKTGRPLVPIPLAVLTFCLAATPRPAAAGEAFVNFESP